jgi:hypothetical protein
MPTIIDQLLVTLGLDAADFEKGADKANAAQKKLGDQAGSSAKDIEKQEKKLAEAQAARAKELEARAKQIAQGVSKLRNEALALFAAFTGGKSLVGFVTGTISAEAGLSRMSANLGMSATELAQWQLANERAGGSTAGMTEQIKEASSELAKLRTGGGSEKIMELFNWGAMAGVSINPDELKTGTDVLMARAKVLEALVKIDPAKALVAASAMGVSEDTFNLLKQGPVLVEQQRIAQRRLAEEMARNAPAAEELRKKWNDLSHSFEEMAIKIVPKLMPYLERFANWFIGIIPDIEAFATKVDKVIESLGGWTNVLVALGALKLLSMAGGLTAIGTALNVIAASFAVIGGAVGAAALATMTGIALLTHSGGLNKGEDEELARRRKLPATIDGPVPLPASGAQANEAAALPAKAAPMYPKTPTPTSGNPGAAAVFTELEKRDGLPAGTLDSMWLQESGRGKNMLSGAGAKGHFQFMEPTAKQYGLKDPNNLAESADAASRMMRDLLKKYNGDLSMALMAYNGGQGNLDRKGAAGMPAESKAYAPSVMSRIEDPAQSKRSGELATNQAGGAVRRPQPGAEVATMFNVTEQGRRNAMAAVNMPSGAALAAARNGGNNSTSTTDVKVGQITVQTQATDAKGIAKDIGAAINKYGFMSQANTGLA